ncbi:trace amine-associated receptor 1-like [Betta splendens]|uniref:Trace amine-associated receptor 1-like n=1 Tax=Betta splendens TaxID=158456 RepID=A0A6P7N0R8_BETSP|nr:trace amine-associated receptor 1-like [Betta splendens]
MLHRELQVFSSSYSISLVMETVVEAELCFPELGNSSCKKHLRPRSEALLIYSVLCCISLLTVVLNLLVIVSISHFRQLHTPTNLLLLSLAVSDFLVGLIVMPFEIVLNETCWLPGDPLCAAYYILPFIGVSASVGNMVLISVDRYVAICDPLRYPTKVTQSAVKVCVLLCWFNSALYNLAFLFNNLKQSDKFYSCHGECAININGAVDLMISFFIPITAIVLMYMRVFVVAVSQTRALRSQITAVKSKHSLTVQKSELKAARTLGVVVAVFLLCYCPYYCVTLSGYNLTMVSSTKAFLDFLVLFNSSLNPGIYTFLYPWFRKSIKLIVTLAILQPNSSKAKVM